MEQNPDQDHQMLLTFSVKPPLTADLTTPISFQHPGSFTYYAYYLLPVQIPSPPPPPTLPHTHTHSLASKFYKGQGLVLLLLGPKQNPNSVCHIAGTR